MEQQGTNKYSGKKLLIVDDDADMRLLLAEYFRRLGFEVHERDSGQSALEPAVTGNFDCLILDVSMPGMTGPDLLRELKARGQAVPTVFITAHGGAAMRPRLIELGAVECLSKPFSDTALRAALDVALGAR